jgi:hypothetical protein
VFASPAPAPALAYLTLCPGRDMRIIERRGWIYQQGNVQTVNKAPSMSPMCHCLGCIGCCISETKVRHKTKKVLAVYLAYPNRSIGGRYRDKRGWDAWGGCDAKNGSPLPCLAFTEAKSKRPMISQSRISPLTRRAIFSTIERPPSFAEGPRTCSISDDRRDRDRWSGR